MTLARSSQRSVDTLPDTYWRTGRDLKASGANHAYVAQCSLICGGALCALNEPHRDIDGESNWHFERSIARR